MPTLSANNLDTLLEHVRSCNLCATQLPHTPHPVLRARSSARILVVGQAPGTHVHATGIPWNDASGRRLRKWMGLSDEQFYDENNIAIVPMGFCYPGKGKSGDLPPRPECAKTWHGPILDLLPDIETTLLIGQYSQRFYQPCNYSTLTERVRNWQLFAPQQFVLPHPSPRNQLWLRRNPWFEEAVVPALQRTIAHLLGQKTS